MDFELDLGLGLIDKKVLHSPVSNPAHPADVPTVPCGSNDACAEVKRVDHLGVWQQKVSLKDPTQRHLGAVRIEAHVHSPAWPRFVLLEVDDLPVNVVHTLLLVLELDGLQQVPVVVPPLGLKSQAPALDVVDLDPRDPLLDLLCGEECGLHPAHSLGLVVLRQLLHTLGRGQSEMAIGLELDVGDVEVILVLDLIEGQGQGSWQVSQDA